MRRGIFSLLLFLYYLISSIYAILKKISIAPFWEGISNRKSVFLLIYLFSSGIAGNIQEILLVYYGDWVDIPIKSGLLAYYFTYLRVN